MIQNQYYYDPILGLQFTPKTQRERIRESFSLFAKNMNNLAQSMKLLSYRGKEFCQAFEEISKRSSSMQNIHIVDHLALIDSRPELDKEEFKRKMTKLRIQTQQNEELIKEYQEIPTHAPMLKMKIGWGDNLPTFINRKQGIPLLLNILESLKANKP